MTTKSEERKALAQIRKIVEGLGEDSYIGTAFEGCFELALQNIENDWCCSMKERAEAAEKKAEDLESCVESLKADKDVLEADNESFKDMIIRSSDRSREAEAQIDILCQELHKKDELLDQRVKEAEEMELEIMKLKAQLYDYMTM